MALRSQTETRNYFYFQVTIENCAALPKLAVIEELKVKKKSILCPSTARDSLDKFCQHCDALRRVQSLVCFIFQLRVAHTVLP